MNRTALTVAALALVAGTTSAQVTYEPIAQDFIGLDLSYDGEAMAGNDAWNYDAFRWTRAGGIEHFTDRSTMAVFGSGAGTPDISYDGTRVSAQVMDATGTFMTPGLWVEGSGWIDVFPPLLSDGGILDNSYGSCWGLSGDGLTVAGFYWRPNQLGGLAHVLNWTQAGGPVSLADLDEEPNSRINALSYDGAVSVGWEEEPFGNWQPHVWRGGVDYQLSAPNEGWCMANETNHDGSVVVGQTVTGPSINLTSNAAMWTWNGAGYDETILGTLPGTPLGSTGSVWAESVADDRDMITGTNRFFNNGPYSNETGFIWTPRTGMFDVVDYMADNGITLPVDIMVAGMPSISPDGSTIIVIIKDTTLFNTYGTALLHIPVPCSDADVTTTGAPVGNTNYGMADGQVTGADINYYVNAWIGADLITGDMTTTGAGIGDPGYGVPDGQVTGADIQYYVNLWVAGCP